MTNEQQAKINTIVMGSSSGTAQQFAQWREVASFVYANALRDSYISSLELKVAFEPLQKIATSASFSDNSKAVARAITQPFSNGVDAIRNGSSLANIASAAIKLADDPLANVKSLWNGLKATGYTAIQLAEHESGLLSMEERNRLAAIYDLSFDKRIQALHGVALQDTAAMVSAGSLASFLPNALTKAKVMVGGAGARLAHEVNAIPTRYGANALPALAGASAIDNLISLPGVVGMASKDGKIGQGGIASSEQGFDIKKYEVPDPNFDLDLYMARQRFAVNLKDFTEHMSALGFKDQGRLIKENIEHLMDVRVVQNSEEFRLIFNRIQELINNAEIAEFNNATAAGMSHNQALEENKITSQKFFSMRKFIDEERTRNFQDLLISEDKYALMEQAKLNIDAVGYNRTAEPRTMTERELNHHIYLNRLRESVADLRVKLELLGLQSRANSLDECVSEMLMVRLEDSQSAHNQDLAAFMQIEEEARVADITKSSYKNISENYFKMIQEEIGGDLAHIKEEIWQDREYHIRHQLWQRQHVDELRAADKLTIETIRSDLFGKDQTGSATVEPPPEL